MSRDEKKFSLNEYFAEYQHWHTLIQAELLMSIITLTSHHLPLPPLLFSWPTPSRWRKETQNCNPPPAVAAAATRFFSVGSRHRAREMDSSVVESRETSAFFKAVGCRRRRYGSALETRRRRETLEKQLDLCIGNRRERGGDTQMFRNDCKNSLYMIINTKPIKPVFVRGLFSYGY